MNPPKHIVSAAAVVINDKNELLLIKGPRRGWEMPEGQVEIGESLTQAAIRETKEESGIDIEIIKFCGLFQNTGNAVRHIRLRRMSCISNRYRKSGIRKSKRMRKKENAWTLKQQTTCEVNRRIRFRFSLSFFGFVHTPKLSEIV
ncbi:NUDIX hydrolase [Paenibacillus vini]|uniref:Nudix hydrolase domain-containing protein n=1 Tax=Paenibacillus vini TaxID=1476024 RepID=A0ABQ4MC94_9BACL|nr:NUDIX hydrolase [Paenibacillus vini]GIP53614.1 hypothetical protein J42TS3_26490 [Paenibacillus vini]